MIDKIVSHYRITAQLGEGGMGVVYRAEDTRLGRHVAIKFLPKEVAEDELARGRFEREAKTASSLNHPNICAIYDIGEFEGQPYIVMELLSGQTLKQLIGRQPLDANVFQSLAVEIADALDAAHGIGIIHRDIKSTNIFVDARGHAKLLDFGLAKLVREPQLRATDGYAPTSEFVHSPMHTTTGSVMGTMNYMSPEQARGEELDARSDVFSLGVVLYEMATARTPFGGKTIAVTFDLILNKTPDSIHLFNPDFPAALAGVIHKALEKLPEARYQSAKELRDDLQNLQGPMSSSRVLVPAQATPGAADTSRLLTPAAETTERPQTPSIAVLPFVNLSGNSDNDYFGDGLAEELISSLMNVKGVQVVARTSAFQFKGQSLDVREIGERLNVKTVLEGSFRMAGNRIRISANFINVEDGYQLWSDRFDRDMEDVFAVQDEISQTIVHALEVTLGGRTQKVMLQRPTENVEAYNHYLRGRFHWKKRTPDAIHKAVECFKEALEIDAEYAKAHAGLADCYAMLGTYAVMPRSVVMPQARSAAERALELDAKLAEPHAALGIVAAIHEFDWTASEKHFERAVELSPDYATARYWYAIFMLLPNARFDEAIGQANWAAQLDPVTPTINAAAALVYYMQREYDRALESIQAAMELDEVNPLTNITACWIYLAKRMFKEAHAAIDRAEPMRVVAAGSRAWAHLLEGDQAKAEALLEELHTMSRQGNSQADFEMARVYTAMGKNDEAFECLERTYEQRGGTLFWLNVNPLFDPLRGDERFQQLLSKLNLASPS